jgi:hypothetical protein
VEGNVNLNCSIKNDSTQTLIEDAPVFSWIGETKFTGRLEPNSAATFTASAAFTYPGLFDVNRWKLTCSMYFPKSLLEASVASKLERVSSRFVQNPTFSQLIEIE